ncbi:cupin domain-containing protein [Neobacillus notoginsengisoli]|uniref:Cupin domain-containing protein n=1 Tax=Neobacillus notoginsengisoli TaxID=1578198 RepID=A0A417YTW6_9BACI|nr:cupin domain-containing protein [Neobacillus notoginsengisoli]RHW40446.1 cupin domain-containing protein [Neobacillus notoginsengisoli]
MAANERSFFLKDDGQIPNNPDLPVIIYEGVFNDNPNGIEETFNRNKWTGSWSGGVFDYHHYHSNAHEVLGVKSGNATVLLGGDAGERVELRAGDVILLPAGTGHKLIKGSEDFEVVGAYPEGTSPNMREKDPAGRAQSLQEIRNILVPETDPVYGDSGPLLRKWMK